MERPGVEFARASDGTYLAYQARAEKALAGWNADFEKLVAGDVASYRKQVQEAGVGLLMEPPAQ